MSSILLFEEKTVRRAWDAENQKWLFAIVDVLAILTGSIDPGAYWRKLKERLKKEGNPTVTNCHGLKMTAADGKQRLTDVADTEQLLRLIQSVPSPKAEPFKLWLAQVGYERLEEIENPELATRRMRQIYEQKGYSEEWIEKRLRGIAVRDELTDEWKKRGVKESREFAILTAVERTIPEKPNSPSQNTASPKKAAPTSKKCSRQKPNLVSAPERGSARGSLRIVQPERARLAGASKTTAPSPQRSEPNDMNGQTPAPHSRQFARFEAPPIPAFNFSLFDFPPLPPWRPLRPLRETIFSVWEFVTFASRTLANSPSESFIHA
jgi:hypothetical protein